MILLDYFKLCVSQKFATFSGRARRQEYWLFYLDCIIVSSALSSLSLSLIHDIVANVIVTTISVAWTLFIIIPSLAVLVRRLHDTNRSGWWLLLYLLPVIGAIVLFVFTLLPGTVGENDYGDDPKASELQAA